MKIGINARYLKDTPGGISNYVLKMVSNFKKIDRENDYILFFGDRRSMPKFALDDGYGYNISRISTGSRIMKILWANFYLPREIEKNKIDLFHETAFVAPAFKKCRTVITIHDLAFLRFPSYYGYRHRAYLSGLLPRSIKQADLIIAGSESVKEDTVNDFDVSPEKIRVIYAGVDETYRPLDDKEKLEKVKNSYGIKRTFILTVSLISPRKNIAGLVRAFKLLKDKRKIDSQLVIVGGKGWLCEEVFKEVRLSGLEGDVIFCGNVSIDDLICLYNMANVFVYPSFYEGFGVPILEAMACGCPVIASNTSAMPEVCGKAALLVDPKDNSELSSAIYNVMADSSLRCRLIKEGLEQKKKFSWRKAAEETVAVYKEAVR